MAQKTIYEKGTNSIQEIYPILDKISNCFYEKSTGHVKHGDSEFSVYDIYHITYDDQKDDYTIGWAGFGKM